MQKRRIKCEYDGCCRTYCSYFNLKRHIESSHLGVRKFKCSLCGKYLSSKQNYIDHQNIHTGAKPYTCEHPGCQLSFRQLSQYYLHRQLHSEAWLHLTSTSQLQNQMVSMLTEKIGKDVPQNYTIPLLPYNVSELLLPKIVQSQEFQLPTFPLDN